MTRGERDGAGKEEQTSRARKERCSQGGRSSERSVKEGRGRRVYQICQKGRFVVLVVDEDLLSVLPSELELSLEADSVELPDEVGFLLGVARPELM